VLYTFLTVLPLTAKVVAQAAAGDSTHSVLIGTVRDAKGIPVPDAEVTVASKASRTDSYGRFTIADLLAGSTSVVVRRLGYAPAKIPVQLSAGQTVQVQIQLTVTPQMLTAMSVEARRDRLSRVFERQAKHLGATLFAEDIPRYRQHDVGGLLQFVPAFAGILARTKTCAGGAAFVDGRPVPPMTGLSEYVHLNDIEAIEVFKSADFVDEIFVSTPFSPEAAPPVHKIGQMTLGTDPPKMGSIKGRCQRLILVWTKFYRGR
jgi:hypothetical protein